MQFELLVNSMGIIGMIPIFLLVLLMLWGFIGGSGRTRTLSLLAFLGYLFVAIGWLVVTMERMNMPLMDWSLARYIDFGVRGIWLFLLAVYCFIWALPDLINERKWLVIVLLILPIVYEALMIGTFSIVSSPYRDAWLVTDAVFVTIYMALIPLYTTIRYVGQDRIKGTARVMWIWLTLIGVLIWFFGELLLGSSQLLNMPGWNSFFSSIGLTVVSTHAIGWWIILLGNFFQRRALQAG
ncbi:MAG: hypothetical protein ACFFAZ_04300 [Promethearchaeota archaeon]